MKKITVLAATFLTLGFTSKAQCDKRIKWVASKTEFVEASGNVNTKDEKVEVTTSKEKFLVVAEDGEEKLNGDITDYSCKWKDKDNGKITFKTVVTDKSGDVRHATITIETINGKTTMLLDAEEEQTKIRLAIDSYEEVK